MKKQLSQTDKKYQVVRLSDIKKSRKGNFIIHLSQQEWNRAVKKVPVSEYNSKLHGELKGVSYRPVHPERPESGMFIFPVLCDPCQVEISKEYTFGRCNCDDMVKTPGGTSGRKSSGNVMTPKCYTTTSNGIVICVGQLCMGCTPERIELVLNGKVVWGIFVCNCP